MKLQCNVCGVETASVICYADEAALCRRCDDCVHSANKLASKHRRFSLLHPSSKTLPLCDICKERRGFIFCQDDRAIFCQGCDLPIHSASNNTNKHIRFLLSGIRLSTAPIPSASSSSSPEMVPSSVTGNSRKASKEDAVCSSHSVATATLNVTSGGNTISDYLMNMLPGWRVDDFLFDDATTAGDLITCHLAVETEVSGRRQQQLQRSISMAGGAVAKMEDVPVWVTPFPAAQATAMVKERLCPLPNSMERDRGEWRDEVSIVPQFQYQHTSKKRSMASFSK